MRRGGDSGYRRGSGQSRWLGIGFKFWGIYGSKVVTIVERLIGVSVRETETRGGVRHEGVRGVFKAVVGAVSLSKPGKSGRLIF